MIARCPNVPLCPATGRAGGNPLNEVGSVHRSSEVCPHGLNPTSVATSSRPTNGHALRCNKPSLGDPTVKVTAAWTAVPKVSPESAFNAGRHIHGQHGQSGVVEARDEFDPSRFERTIQSDAEQAIHHQRRLAQQRLLHRGEIVRRGFDFDEFDAAIGQTASGGADVVAVVPFAGEQQDEIAGLRELQGAVAPRAGRRAG
jgi:hypothetical protein